ncbi:MAG: mechanosensitive ion channel [Limnochordales bacterium]|nr:mechanosensitive ion channel [Limnochordales bacterium]
MKVESPWFEWVPGDALKILWSSLLTWAGRLLLTVVYFLVAALIVRLLLGLLTFVRTRTRWNLGLNLLRREGSAVLFSLFQGLITYAGYTVAALLVLRRVFGVDTAALITASGIVGLAIGFGTQGLVRDFVSGLLLVLDGSIRPGDVVEIAGQSGVVQEVSFRTTRLVDAQGEVRHIPNGNIGAIVNYRGSGVEAVVNVFLAEMPDEKRNEILLHLKETLGALLREVPIFKEQWKACFHELPGTGTILLELSVCLLPSRRQLVDQMLVPVIRDSLAQAGITPHQDRIVVYYRQPESSAENERPVPIIGRRWRS